MNYPAFLRRNARFLAFGFVVAFFSSFGQTFFISLSGEQIRGTFDLTHGDFGLWYSLATLASGMTLIWIGRRIDVTDLRVFTCLVCGGLVLACAAVAAAPTVLALAGGLFLLRLTGQGLMSHTAMTSMARYYDEDRGKALSIAGLGFPAGEAVLPIAAVAVIAAAGWRQTWAALAALLLVIVIPLVLWLLRGHGARHAAHLAALRDGHDEATAPGLSGRQWTRLEVLADPRFYLLLPAVIGPGFIVTGLFFHQQHLVATKGWTMTMFAGCFAVFAGLQLPSNLVAGPVVDRFGSRRLMPILLVPLAAGVGVLAAGRHVAIAPLFMALAGVTSGLCGAVIGALWAELYGVRHLGAIRALVTAIGVFGTAASPVSMGWLIDRGVSMDTIAAGCVAYCVGAAVLSILALRLPTPGDAP